MIVDRLILKNNSLRSPPVSPSYPKKVRDYLKQGLSFQCVVFRRMEKSDFGLFLKIFITITNNPYQQRALDETIIDNHIFEKLNAFPLLPRYPKQVWDYLKEGLFLQEYDWLV